MKNDNVMGERILVYLDDHVFYAKKEIDLDLFISFINELIDSGWNLTFYETLSGFMFSNPKNNARYFLQFSVLDIERYKKGIYTTLTSELKKLIEKQSKKEILEENFIKRITKKLKK